MANQVADFFLTDEIKDIIAHDYPSQNYEELYKKAFYDSGSDNCSEYSMNTTSWD